jgi:hypothetical protein
MARWDASPEVDLEAVWLIVLRISRNTYRPPSSLNSSRAGLGNVNGLLFWKIVLKLSLQARPTSRSEKNQRPVADGIMGERKLLLSLSLLSLW